MLCCAVRCRQLHGTTDFTALARVIPVAVAYREAPLQVSIYFPHAFACQNLTNPAAISNSPLVTVIIT